MFSKQIVKKLNKVKTPYYYYDLAMLRETLGIIRRESDKYGFIIHYAVKANANPRILEIISSYGFGADCVSGNEIIRAIETGFDPKMIAFAGVGKTDEEINIALNKKIFSINVESLPEYEVVNSLAGKKNLSACVALRINPNVEAFTHKYITTGIEETKFGINMWDLESVVDNPDRFGNTKITGLHFHIGSQIRRMTAFKALCSRINEIQLWFESRNIYPEHINVGGGLGIDYENPGMLPDFEEFFSIFNELLDLRKDQKVHFELGRSVVGQVGNLLTRVLYVKNGAETRFIIVDAGMTDLIRPALYQAYHQIDNLTSDGKKQKYNVVGPICESADSFGKFIDLPETRRGDLIAIRSAGAYGEVMISGYNLKNPPGTVFSDDI
ncbi:MAG TPA: diaminopimelate decarboxylase [Bacteroidales bacterium]|nr:diaminopimelate decarboxylase [Bacteroidales bacterium]